MSDGFAGYVSVIDHHEAAPAIFSGNTDIATGWEMTLPRWAVGLLGFVAGIVLTPALWIAVPDLIWGDDTLQTYGCNKLIAKRTADPGETVVSMEKTGEPKYVCAELVKFNGEQPLVWARP